MKGLLLLIVFAAQVAVTPAGGTVVGRLLSAEGAPAANVRVALSPADDPAALGEASLLNLTLTDSDGRYRMEGVPVGRYYITAGFVDLPTYFPGVSRRADADVIDVTTEAVVEAPDFRLAKIAGFHIRGRVELEKVSIDRVGTPLTVYLTGGPSRIPSAVARGATSVGVGANGTFEFSGLRPGRYSLRIRPNVTMTPATITVTDRDVEDVLIRVPASGIYAAVNGRVIMDADGLQPWFQVVLTSMAGPVPRLREGERRYGVGGSTFIVGQVPAGQYTVSIRDLPEGYTVESMSLGSIELLTETLTLGPLDQPEITIRLGVSNPPPWVRVVGRMVNVDGARLPSAISISGQPLGSGIVANVNAEGTFEFPRVLPGTYAVALRPAADDFTRTITVGRTDAIVEVSLKIPSVKVSGTLTGEDEARRQGRLSPGCFVRPMLLREGRPPSLSRSLSAKLEPDGTFEFASVQAGSYRLVKGRSCGDVTSVPVDTGIPIVVEDKDIIGLVLPAY